VDDNIFFTHFPTLAENVTASGWQHNKLLLVSLQDETLGMCNGMVAIRREKGNCSRLHFFVVCSRCHHSHDDDA
jgi:hypothetical protein